MTARAVTDHMPFDGHRNCDEWSFASFIPRDAHRQAILHGGPGESRFVAQLSPETSDVNQASHRRIGNNG